MASITTRVQGDDAKGSPLTNVEVDNNFINLNTAKYESGDDINVGAITADDINVGAITADSLSTSGRVKGGSLATDKVIEASDDLNGWVTTNPIAIITGGSSAYDGRRIEVTVTHRGQYWANAVFYHYAAGTTAGDGSLYRAEMDANNGSVYIQAKFDSSDDTIEIYSNITTSPTADTVCSVKALHADSGGLLTITINPGASVLVNPEDATDTTAAYQYRYGITKFGDNDKAYFGDGNDLKIYHDSSNKIDSTGQLNITATSGDVVIRGSDNIYLQGSTANENFLKADENGAVTLYYDNAPKLATTSTGIDVTGTVTADGLTVDDDQKINLHGGVDSYDELFRDTTGNATIIRARNNVRVNLDSNSDSTTDATFVVGYDGLDTSTKKALEVKEGGDISFYEDQGVTPKLVWKAADERLGIGTSSPSVPFHVNGGTENIVAKFESSDADALIQFTDNATSDTILLGALTDDLLFRCDPGNIIFNTNNNSEAMRIDSDGNLEMTGGGSIGWANYTFVEEGDYLYVYNGSTKIMRVDASGNAAFAGDVEANATL
jgi:hypothetical protein